MRESIDRIASRPVAYITGWRVRSEVLTRKWSHVDFATGKVILEHYEAKNKEPREFVFTRDLRALLEKQHAEHERLRKKFRSIE